MWEPLFCGGPEPRDSGSSTTSGPVLHPERRGWGLQQWKFGFGFSKKSSVIIADYFVALNRRSNHGNNSRSLEIPGNSVFGKRKTFVCDLKKSL